MAGLNSNDMRRASMLRILLLIGLVIGSLCLVSSPHAENVTLVWDANTDPDLAGYKVYWGDVSRTYSSHVDVAKETQAIIDIKPEDGRTVYFAATAYDNYDNESDYSEEVTWQVPDKTAPAKVQKFRLIIDLIFNKGNLILEKTQIKNIK